MNADIKLFCQPFIVEFAAFLETLPRVITLYRADAGARTQLLNEFLFVEFFGVYLWQDNSVSFDCRNRQICAWPGRPSSQLALLTGKVPS